MTTKTRKNDTKKHASIDDIIITRKVKTERVPLLTSSNVPAGRYDSRVDSIATSKTDKGKPAVDVVYEFTDASGTRYKAKVRYELDSYFYEKFTNAMLDAGLPNGGSLSQAIGITEKLEVTYAYEGALGKLVNRRPASAAKPANTRSPAASIDDDDDEDTDFDDFVDEIEDEDVKDADDEFEDFFVEDDD